MKQESQISAVISSSTRELLERHARATGVKKGYLIEEALRHHLMALSQLPADVIVHPTLVVSPKSGAAVLRQIESGKPPIALRNLMRGGD